MKLFKEWIGQWNSDNREAFLKQLTDIDANFVDKLTEELQKDPQVNGTYEATENHEILED